MNILLNWIEPNWKFESIFELNFPGKKIIEYFFELNIPEKYDIEQSFELNFIVKWMNNSIFESIFAVFDDKPPFLSILDTFWPIFGHFSYSTSINHSLTIELNNILNWITRVYFELNNILNWILGKAILNRILNESFFGKIQILNWIRLGIVHHYLMMLLYFTEKVFFASILENLTEPNKFYTKAICTICDKFHVCFQQC